MATIHLLEVKPDMSLRELKKLSRRYAMTGGYELSLPSDLQLADIEKMQALYLPELSEYPSGSAARRSCNAYRILQLLSEHENCPQSLRGSIEQELEANS